VLRHPHRGVTQGSGRAGQPCCPGVRAERTVNREIPHRFLTALPTLEGWKIVEGNMVQVMRSYATAWNHWSPVRYGLTVDHYRTKGGRKATTIGVQTQD